MRIGIMYGGARGAGTVDAVVAEAKRLEARGFATLWIPHILGLDAITVAAIAGRETRRIEIGTAVVPTYPRHPLALAQQALTANAAAAGRFTLGIGLSHQVLIEGVYGLSYAHPARHMREYLEVLGPLLRGANVDFQGEQYRVRGALQLPEGVSPGLVLAALGPRMLELAGRACDGTITWMTGPRTLESHVVPALRAAAERAGRPRPRVVAGLPIALTNRPDEAREKIGKTFAIYGTLPSSRAMLDREGVEGPAGVALVGDEPALRAQLARLRDVGVTDLDASIAPVDEHAAERTLELLADVR
jgi:F420-dependent oxidoreductase-like protein